MTQQPGTCLNCHASAYDAYRRAGNGDRIAGFARLNAMPYQEARSFVEHPVSCIDCHDHGSMQLRITRPALMEGMRQMKVSDHWVRSQVLNINKACQTCHKLSEDELRDRVRTIQDRTYELRNLAMDAVLRLIDDIAAAARSDSVRHGTRIASARDFQRKAQFLTDFIEAENSMGFHAPQEAARVLARAIDYARRGQIELAGANLFPAPAGAP